MKTETLRLTGDPAEDRPFFLRAGKILREGGLVAMPTETVYGLAGDALNPRAAERIYAAKGRPSDNPLIVHIADLAALPLIAREIPRAAVILGEKIWPGPLTMVFQKTDLVPKETTGGLDTVAVRLPSHEAARSLIRAAGGFVAAPSANRSGRPSCTTAAHVKEDMDGRIPLILDAGPVGIGLESTIIDLTGPVPCLLRPGYIGPDALRDLLGEVETDPAADGTEDAKEPSHPKAPGMKYRHYAPKGELTIVKGGQEDVIRTINSLVEEKESRGIRTAVLAAEETAGYYRCGIVKTLGSKSDGESIARNLFRVLRELDSLRAEVIYTEEFDTPVMGMAIMNRLVRAAGHREILAEKGKGI